MRRKLILLALVAPAVVTTPALSQAPLRATETASDPNDHSPSWSPDGQQILFTSRRDTAYALYIVRPGGGDAVRRFPGLGIPQRAAEWSPDGRRVAFTSWPDEAFEQGELYVIDAEGSNLRRLTRNTVPDGDGLSWSPVGAWIAFWSERDGNRDVYAIRPDGTGLRRLTTHPAEDRDPDFAPDGRQIAFWSYRDGGRDGEIWVMNADGTNPRQLTSNDAYDGYPRWSPDGKHILFFSDRADGWQVWIMEADGSSQRPLTATRGCNFDPGWSPDGARIVFNSCRDGRRGTYVMNADGTGQRKISNTRHSEFIAVARTQGVDTALQRLRISPDRAGRAVYFFESEARMLGLELLDEGRTADALTLLGLNTRTYPGSNEAWTALAQARRTAGLPAPPAVAEIVARFRTDGTEAGIKDVWSARRQFPEWPLAYEAGINTLGYQLLSRGDAQSAVQIFLANAGLYPGSGNVWDSLAEGYLTLGDTTRAVLLYAKSVRIDPSNDNGRRMLDRICTSTANTPRSTCRR